MSYENEIMILKKQIDFLIDAMGECNHCALDKCERGDMDCESCWRERSRAKAEAEAAEELSKFSDMEKEILQDAANIRFSSGYLTEAKAFYEKAKCPHGRYIARLAGEILSLRASVDSLRKENAAVAACAAVAMMSTPDQCKAMGSALGRHAENKTQNMGGLRGLQ